MSDFDRNAAAARYGQTAGREDTAIVDQGLRSYLLHVYNYMAIGLAITGLAALGIYMLSVTNDAAAAAKIMRGGAEVAVRIPGNLYLTSIGYALFASPLKWAVFLAPLALVFVVSFGIERMRPAAAQILFWVLAA